MRVVGAPVVARAAASYVPEGRHNARGFPPGLNGAGAGVIIVGVREGPGLTSFAADLKRGLLAALIASLGLLPAAAHAREDWYCRLARHWAPNIFQNVDTGAANPEGRYDFITRADFDDDTRGDNNWENADDRRKMDFPLRPFVYYSVIETRTHYYLTYSLFHPRDWQWYLAAEAAGGDAPLPATHENDLESATVVILKDGGYGRLRLVGTVCHLQNYCFVADAGIRPRPSAWDLSSGELQVSFFEDRPCLFVEAGGHGIGGLGRAMREDPEGAYEIGSRRYSFQGGTGIVYRCSDDPDFIPGSEPVVASGGSAGAGPDYQLIPILDSLWPLRHDAGGEAMFEDVFTYEIAPGCRLDGLPLLFAAGDQDAGANPPWARDATGDGLARGDWFFRPAQAMDRYLDAWPDRNSPGYDHYIRNPYIAGDNVITVVSPETDRTRIAGFPMKIAWETHPAPPALSDAVRVYLSRNAGRTWRLVSSSAGTGGGQVVWDVTGPSGAECLIAVRAALTCDPGVEVVGYSSLFPVSEPAAFTWSAIREHEETGLPRSNAQAVYDPLGDRLVLFGGLSAEPLNDVRAFDFLDLTWKQVNGGASGGPQARYSHAGALDTGRGRLVIYGGWGGQYFDDTWAFDFEAAEWQRLDTDGQDTRSGCVAVYDPAGEALVVFGGSDATGAKNDVRALRLEARPALVREDGTTPAAAAQSGAARRDILHWETLHSGAEPAPVARADGAGAYDAARRRIIVHAGRAGAIEDVPLSDTWAFSLESREWVLLHDGSGQCPPARWGHVAAMDDEAGRLIVHGGSDGAVDYGDTWLFDLERLEWTEIAGGTAGPAPAPRSGAAGIIRERGGQLVIAGGRGRTGPLDDVWSLGLEQSNWPRKEQGLAGDETFNRDPVIWPNPTRSGVSIDFTLAAAGRLKLAVYDVRGRLIRTIRDSEARAGFHTVDWDGRDSAGAGVGSGVYFCVISTEGRSVERPVVVLR